MSINNSRTKHEYITIKTYSLFSFPLKVDKTLLLSNACIISFDDPTRLFMHAKCQINKYRPEIRDIFKRPNLPIKKNCRSDVLRLG